MNTNKAELIPAPPSVLEAIRAFSADRASIALYDRPTVSMTERIKKSETDPKESSRQKTGTGRKEHPFDMKIVRNFMSANVHHARCIRAKVAATVGLGFMTEEQKKNAGKPQVEGTPKKKTTSASKASTVLDPLCENTFAELMSDIAEDYWNLGTGYMECVRGEGDKILGLYHLPAPDTHVYVEDALKNRSYEVTGLDGVISETRWPRFGDKEDFLKRNNKSDETMISEIIAFRNPTSQNKYYGYPDWLACTPHIEVTQCVHQHIFDYYLNRGVPEYMLFITGCTLNKDDWAKVEAAIRSNVGLGNSHKSLALNISNPDVKIQLEKLALDGGSGDSKITDTKDNMALDIVSAHGVPPLLAGIQIPGKLGATNELPNALMAFQVLVIGQAQGHISQTLGNTLGNSLVNGGLGLTVDDFQFNTIVDQIDIGMMDTVGRMRETVPEAKASGRNMSAGLKD